MAFIQPCFIKKNTPELRKKLEELGYTYNGRDTKSWGASALYCFDGKYHEAYPAKPSRYHSIVDCGTNEELFLALAALRDDTDKNQWLTDGKIWGKFGEDSFLHPIQIINYLQSKGHKATVEEIIEHFKDK